MSIATPTTVLPLEPIELTVNPKSTHNLAWSPDAELAVAVDDSVIIFVPEFFPRPGLSPDEPNVSSAPYDGPTQFSEVRSLRFPTTPLRHREFNRHLFENVGQEFDALLHFTGAGTGFGVDGQTVLVAHGGTLNHVVAVEWSPAGLGRVGRSVLAVLSSAGVITVYCQGKSDESSSMGVNGAGDAKGKERKSRSLRPWCAAWCVGAGLFVPVAPGPDGRVSEGKREAVVSFSWARDFASLTADMGNSKNEGNGGRDSACAILSYLNDEDELVILEIGARHDDGDGTGKMPTGHPGIWRVLEVARCRLEGPHFDSDPTDPDHNSYSRSSFALSWSPWLKRGSTSSTCFVAYVSRNYVGFRQVTIDWSGGNEKSSNSRQRLKVDVASVDASGICVYLGPDAFVVWEDLIWTMGNSKVCRGIIATPMRVTSFELPFDSTTPMPKHSTEVCGTTYPDEEFAERTNPITGLLIHPPSLSQNTETPSYSLVRLSATHQNRDWHQTNLPLPTNPEDENSKTRWAMEISQTIEHQVPRALARRSANNMGRRNGDGGGSDDDDFDNESEDDDDDDDDEGSTDEALLESETNTGSDDSSLLAGIVSGIDTTDQVHPNRIRIWGMAASPGGGTNAVFISLHSTLDLERDISSGMKCRVLFGLPNYHVHYNSHDDIGDGGRSTVEAGVVRAVPRNLSTEARAWEWMYGGGAPLTLKRRGGQGGGAGNGGEDEDESAVALREQFLLVAARQACVFCKLPLGASQSQGESSASGNVVRCSNQHVFEICANTGVPILAPNVSRTCGVCGLKSLKTEELVLLAPQLKDIIADEISSDLCGSCGGKFIV
ncbi:hypothetical protein F5Y16DRAFT_153203 [Xylariaceae sp. FL0255]|nr:hypothetical protein F5Y16DRAFT_153203 [Xylariaceae sp. FL0255]